MTKHTELVSAMKVDDCDGVQNLLATHPDLVNSPDWTPPPLHCAVLWDQPDIARVLLDHGADLEMLDPDRQTTALRYAIVYCKPTLITLFVERGANVGPIVENGTTAFQLAQDAAGGSLEEYEELPTRAEYHEIVKLLTELGLSA